VCQILKNVAAISNENVTKYQTKIPGKDKIIELGLSGLINDL